MILSGFASAAATYPTATIVVHRVQAIDDMDFFSLVSAWIVQVGIDEGDGWTWKTYTGGTNGDQTLDVTFTFTVHSHTVDLALMACDDDGGSGNDMADLSSDSGGGADDNGCPKPASTLPYGVFLGTWDLTTNVITGEDLSTEQGWLKTSGDFDGSTGSDENDASMWFSTSDDYSLPTANAGPEKSAFIGESISLDGSASVTPGASVEEYAWDYQNDGSWDATGRLVSTTFSTKGPHTVSLKITDSLGNVAMDTTVVTIQNRLPVAAFNSSSPYSTSADDFTFVESSTDADGTVASWLWEFGDGTTSTEKNPVHRFSAAGTYEVKLTATDNDGGTHLATNQVIVKPAGILGSAGGMAPEAQLGIVAFLGIAIAAVALLLMRRRGKDPATQEGTAIPPPATTSAPPMMATPPPPPNTGSPPSPP